MNAPDSRVDLRTAGLAGPVPGDAPGEDERLSLQEVAHALGFHFARSAAAVPADDEARLRHWLGSGEIDARQAEVLARAVRPGSRDMAEVLGWLGVPARHVRAALARVEASAESLACVMNDFGFLSPEKVARALALQSMRHPYLSPADADALELSEVAQTGLIGAHFPGWVPVAIEGDGAAVRVVVSGLEHMTQARNALFRYRLRFAIASALTVRALFQRFFSSSERQFDEALRQIQQTLRLGAAAGESEASPTALRDCLEALLRHACDVGASDVYLHGTGTVGVIKFKVDGAGQIFRTVPLEVLDRLINKLVHYARVREDSLRGDGLRDGALDPGEGDLALQRDLFVRFSFRVELGHARAGRTAVVRVLDRHSHTVDFDALGFDGTVAARLREYCASASGLVLIAGPTGSGKTTTLYAMLKEIDPEATSIQSIENPVEFRHGLWMQYEMRRTAANEGVEWARWLKGLLRNAPDVILMGEVRDSDTARTLLDGANTGHLVFTTLHTNSAASAIGRLQRLGIDRDELAGALLGVLAQRLVRRLCVHCAVEDERPATRDMLARAGLSGSAVRPRRADPAGCPGCASTGYRGRALVYELLDVGRATRRLIESGAPTSRIDETAIGPARSLLACGLRLVATGVTSIDEVRRIAPVDPAVAEGVA